MRITKRGHFHAQQLQFGAHIGPAEPGWLGGQMPGQHARHLIARRHQAKNLSVPQGTFADSVDIVIAGLADVIDRNAAAWANADIGGAGQLVTRPDARREQHQIGGQFATIGKVQHQASVWLGRNLFSLPGGVNRHAQ